MFLLSYNYVLGNLSKDEIQQMLILSKKFENNDKLRLEKAKARHDLLTYCNKRISNPSEFLMEDTEEFKNALIWLENNPKLSTEEILNKLAHLKN